MSTLPLTSSQTVGPFFAPALLREDARRNVLTRPETAGEHIRIEGRVLDGDGVPVPDAMVEIWQADAGWGRSGTNEEGAYLLVTRKPRPLAADDGTQQAPHFEVLVFARGLLKPVYTRMYFPDEEAANGRDPLLSTLGVADRAALVAIPEPEGLRFDIRLQGERQTPFFAR